MKRHPLSRIVAAGAAALAALLAAAGAPAQTFPAKPIKVIVPYAPGGSTDVAARLLASKMQEILKQSVIVENRAGGGAVIGTQAVTTAAPDGYTLGVFNLAALTPVFIKTTPFDTDKDFEPIGGLYRTVYVLGIQTAVPAKTFQEFVQAAKAAPGKMNYSAHVVSAMMPMEVLKKSAGIDLVSVPYKGTSPGMQALMANEVQAMFDLYGPFVPAVKDGRVRIVAVAGEQRLPLIPDVPTMAELGLPQVRAGGTVALWGPAGIPAPVVRTLNAAVNEALKHPEVQARIAADGSIAVPGTPQALRERYKAEHAGWVEAARVSNYKPE